MLQTLHVLIRGCNEMKKLDTRLRDEEADIRRGYSIEEFERIGTWGCLAHAFLDGCYGSFNHLSAEQRY